jgi:peptidoglycan/LPS O-acetylase OafA/YrhL
MGFLRVFLALVVAVDHTNLAPFGYLPFDGSGVAPVLCFFVISGFYMALILETKYRHVPGGIRLFYLNRILRIYPSYLVVVLLTFAMMHVDGKTTIAYWAKPDHWDQPIGDFYSKLSSYPIWTQVVIWASNLLIIGTNFLDAAAFTPSGSIVFAAVQTANDGAVSVPAISGPGLTNAHAFLFFPPAWTLAIELMFYLAAPLLIWKRPIISIIACAALLQMFPSAVVAVAGPFGSTIVCCVLGMLCFFVYRRLPSARWVNVTGVVMALAIVAYFLISNQLPGGLKLKIYGLLALTWFGVPFIFAMSKSMKTDRLVGELSYSLYLSHFLVFKVLSFLLIQQQVAIWYYPALLAVAAALAFGLELPIDRLRQRLIGARDIAVSPVVRKSGPPVVTCRVAEN